MTSHGLVQNYVVKSDVVERLHKIMRRMNKADDTLRFKRQRNKASNMKKYSRLSFYENVSGLIDQYSKTDFKAYWKLVKKLINTNHSVEIPPLHIVENDSLFYNDTGQSRLVK